MKDRIEAELTRLRQQREQAQANLNAITGAIQVLEKLLKESSDGDEQTRD